MLRNVLLGASFVISSAAGLLCGGFGIFLLDSSSKTFLGIDKTWGFVISFIILVVFGLPAFIPAFWVNSDKSSQKQKI